MADGKQQRSPLSFCFYFLMCLLLFTANTNIFTLLYRQLKADGKGFIFAVAVWCSVNNSQLDREIILQEWQIFTQNIQKLFVQSFRKHWYCGYNFPYSVWKCSKQIVQEHRWNWLICSNSRRCGLWCMQLNTTAGNDYDWLIRTLMPVMLWGGRRLQ